MIPPPPALDLTKESCHGDPEPAAGYLSSPSADCIFSRFTNGSPSILPHIDLPTPDAYSETNQQSYEELTIRLHWFCCCCSSSSAVSLPFLLLRRQSPPPPPGAPTAGCGHHKLGSVERQCRNCKQKLISTLRHKREAQRCAFLFLFV